MTDRDETDRDRALGGYDPSAGLSAGRAAQVRKLPVPSLLRSLLSEHLDPGYAAAAASHDRTRHPWLWQLVGALLIAAVFAAAVAQARSTAPGLSEVQRGLVTGVQTAEGSNDELAQRRDELAAAVDDEQRRRLQDGTEGRQLLDRLDALSLADASTPLIGPGLSVTVTEPAADRNLTDLTDVSKQRVQGSRQVILDRDLQLVVNSLWASGAEAVAVGGIRIGPNVTIRQAGGAILVDNHPISSPYTVVAIGAPHGLRDTFERSAGLTRLRLLETSYGVGVSVSTADGLTVPAGTTRDVRFAEQMGP
ncbi:DUF881 domain-containing protein [Mycolicibacterium palauense]|uniref:DUF881 domain-containing protein n=1 Tax=Mycolicibacterium palauense TaxID=2034511 RepID=UPI000BFEF3F3|nr:DUF881 domain-containing protein [Mycolicibacterium palauense]